MEIEGEEDGKQRKKHLRLIFKVRKELALILNVNFFPWPVVWGLCWHCLPRSACAENNGAPVWRVRVVEG